MQNQVEIKKIDLDCPHLSTLQNVLEEGLKQRYKDVYVEEVPCPDLTQAPYYLAAPGLCGNTALVEIGDLSYIRKSLSATKIYDIKRDILEPLGYYHNSFFFGNGITYQPEYDFCELVINASILPNLQREMTIRNKSCIILRNGYQCQVKSLIDSNLKCHGQGCFFLCNGFFSFDHVLKVHVKNKLIPNITSNSDMRSDIDKIHIKPTFFPGNLTLNNMHLVELIDAMQGILQETFGLTGYNIALGGVFFAIRNTQNGTLYTWKHELLKNTCEREAKCTINSPDTIISTFHSSRTKLISLPSGPSINLSNLQSTHSLFHHSSAQRLWVPGQIGINVNDIEYFGYFCPAEKLYRIDEPFLNT